MQIQVNSDKTVTVDVEMIRAVDDDLNRILGRFDSHVTRLEVHLSDINSDKSGPNDKRCLLEARPAGHQPISASAEASTVEAAVKAAGQKMKNALETTFGRAAAKR
jgi:hypothetical protein